jgi:hypothetical protein
MNNQTTQDDSSLPIDQTGNSFASLQILDNSNDDSIQQFYHDPINNVRISNANLINTINTSTSAPQNVTYEFYFPLPNDTRIYHVTYQYTELDPLENARRLNNSINLSHIPSHQFPLHNDIHSLVQQQIHQQVQHPIYQQNDIQHDTTQSTSQVYSNNDIHITTSIPVTGTLSYDMQDTRNTEFQNSS